MHSSETPAFDLERLVPDTLSDDPIERDMLALHLERYRFAARFVRGRRVVDLACGVGYGSRLLADRGAASVTGVDISAESIAYARERYVRSGVTFTLADGMSYAPQERPDAVVSLETIEHVPDAEAFVARLSGWLPVGGVFVGSVPTTLSTDVNPYHLHDFSAADFRALFRSVGLRVIDELVQDQPFNPFGFLRLRGKARRGYGLRPGLARWYARHPEMLARRLGTTLRHGFKNRYLVLAGLRG